MSGRVTGTSSSIDKPLLAMTRRAKDGRLSGTPSGEITWIRCRFANSSTSSLTNGPRLG